MKEHCGERAEKTIAAFTPQISHFPSAMPQMLVALDCSLNTPRQIVIAGRRDARIQGRSLPKFTGIFCPTLSFFSPTEAKGKDFSRKNWRHLTDMAPLKGKATAYVCENFACQAPVTSTDALRELLTK